MLACLFVVFSLSACEVGEVIAVCGSGPGCIAQAPSPHTRDVRIAFTQLVDDTNGDGLLSDGEQARLRVYVEEVAAGAAASLHIFAKNTGETEALGVWAELTATEPSVVLQGCAVAVGPVTFPCDADCSCQAALRAGNQTLGPGQTSSDAILVVDFVVGPQHAGNGASFTLWFHDARDHTWQHKLEVPVHPAKPMVSVGDVLVDDGATGDGVAKPGEELVLSIHAENIGSIPVHGVWAELTTCPAGLVCETLPGDFNKTLEPGEAGSTPVLRVAAVVGEDVIAGELVLQVLLHDEGGEAWEENVTLPVAALAPVPVLDDVALVAESNGDGSVTPGETAIVQISALNAGDATLYGLWAEVEALDDDVFIKHSFALAGIPDLAPGQVTAQPIAAIQWVLDPDAELTHATFTVHLHDAFGSTWSEDFGVDLTP